MGKESPERSQSIHFQHLMAEFSNSLHGGGWVHSVSFSADGNRLAWVGHDSSLSVADATRGMAIYKLKTAYLPLLVRATSKGFAIPLSTEFVCLSCSIKLAACAKGFESSCLPWCKCLEGRQLDSKFKQDNSGFGYYNIGWQKIGLKGNHPCEGLAFSQNPYKSRFLLPLPCEEGLPE